MTGFKTGLGYPTYLGRPYYYVESMPSNIWDANTYVSVYFDASGSMNSIITPITNAMGGDYFSSGDAANQNGVKNVNSLRSVIQDYYATGGIEGSPDWNTNNATNGKTEFEKHVQFINFGSTEATVYCLGSPLKYNAAGTWGTDAPDATAPNHSIFTASNYETTNKCFSDADFVTPSNFVQIVVGNESHTRYHDGLFGASWNNAEQTAQYRKDVEFLRYAIGENSYSGQAHAFSGGDPISVDQRADGATPSFTFVYIAPGLSSHYHNREIYTNTSGGAATASQAMWQAGVRDGENLYAVDGYASGYTMGLVDLDDHTTWNGRQNKLTLTTLTNQSANTSVSYWRNILLDAFLSNVLLP